MGRPSEALEDISWACVKPRKTNTRRMERPGKQSCGKFHNPPTLGGVESLEGTKNLSFWQKNLLWCWEVRKDTTDTEQSYEGDAQFPKVQRSQTRAVGMGLLVQKLQNIVCSLFLTPHCTVSSQRVHLSLHGLSPGLVHDSRCSVIICPMNRQQEHKSHLLTPNPIVSTISRGSIIPFPNRCHFFFFFFVCFPFVLAIVRCLFSVQLTGSLPHSPGVHILWGG